MKQQQQIARVWCQECGWSSEATDLTGLVCHSITHATTPRQGGWFTDVSACGCITNRSVRGEEVRYHCAQHASGANPWEA